MVTAKKSSRSHVANIASRNLIDTRRLFYFFHVARMGSFSAAEAFLDIAQSAMSRQIQQLEADIGVQLLDRNGRGVLLTEYGEILFKQAGQILDEMSNTLKQIDLARQRPAGQISIGGSAVVMAQYMPEILHRFMAQFPDFQVTAIQASTGELYEQVVDGRLDVGIVLYVPNSNKLASHRLMVEPLLLVAKKDHPIAQKTTITPKDLTSLEMVLPASSHGMRERIDEYCTVNAITLKCQLQIDSVPLIKAIVSEGKSCAIMPQSSFDREFDPSIFAAAPFRPALSRTLYVASLSERAKLPYVSALTRHIIDVFKA